MTNVLQCRIGIAVIRSVRDSYSNQLHATLQRDRRLTVGRSVENIYTNISNAKMPYTNILSPKHILENAGKDRHLQYFVVFKEYIQQL